MGEVEWELVEIECCGSGLVLCLSVVLLCSVVMYCCSGVL